MPLLKVTHPNSERTEYKFGDVSVSIGREGDNMIVLENSVVSRHHAEISKDEEGWWLKDLKSVHGIVVRGRKVTRLRLEDRMSFEIGGSQFRFMLAPGDGTAENPMPEGRKKGGKQQDGEHSCTDTRAAPAVNEMSAIPTELSSPASTVLSCPAVTGRAISWWRLVAALGLGGLLAYQLAVRADPGLRPSVSAGMEDDAKPLTLPVEMKVPELDAAPPDVIEEKVAELPSEVPKAVFEKSAIAGGSESAALPRKQEPAVSVEVLSQRIRGQEKEMHVLSPDLRSVLHLAAAGTSSGSLSNLMLNDKVVFEGIRVATQADMRFAAEGSRWMVHGTTADGRRLILLPDRTLRVVGSLQSLLGNKDFSVITHVARHGGEDHLHINGQVVSSYRHISGAQISENGRHWAYVAVKDPESVHSARPAGERVIFDSGTGPITDRVRELRLSPDGARMAYVARNQFGGESLIVDGRVIHALDPGDGASISQLTFAPTGHRFAWMLTRKDALPVFHVDDLLPVGIAISEVVAKAAVFSRPFLDGLVRFSQDGKHVAFAVTGGGSAVYFDGLKLGEYPALQSDSLTLSPDGRRVAFVTFHPDDRTALVDGTQQAGLQSLQAHLRVSGEVVQSVGFFARRLGGSLSLKVGGFGRVAFSPDSAHVAASVFGLGQSHEISLRQDVFVDGKKLPIQEERADFFSWSDTGDLVVASQDDSCIRVFNLKAEH